jgi:hypothetical protein
MTPREQMKMLRELLKHADEHEDDLDGANWPADFENMLQRMEGGQLVKLSLKQEGYVKGVYERVFDAPQYENLFSTGQAPKGSYGGTEVPAVLRGPRPLKPPGRA